MVLQNVSKVSSTGSSRPILTNTYINAYRRERRQPVHCSTEQVTEQSLAAAYARFNPAQRSAEDQVLDSLPDRDIEAAMHALPPQFREVVYYADVEGLRYKEIAAMMKTPRVTVMSRLARGRRQLRVALTPDGGLRDVGFEAS